jgi:uncharacterized protein with von Willebrand factor type A (vWA) domain
MFSVIGREVLREKTPSLQDLERSLQDLSAPKQKEQHGETGQKINRGAQEADVIRGLEQRMFAEIPIVTQLVQKGYLRYSDKWLTRKGFALTGSKILSDVMETLKRDELGAHETTRLGRGAIVMDTTKRYEPGDDIRLVSVPQSLLNAVQRLAKLCKPVRIPLDVHLADLEEYETMKDVRVAVVYCIDLSSTMRYSSMFGDMSRIEAAKRALWSLFVLNQKFFPSDSISIVGFGALASRVAPDDIPYLKTFEPGSDFLHYTNYQSAFRLASKLLQRDPASNKRIVLVTDGHPSACFIDNKREQDKILSQKPYSHFYSPDKDTLEASKDKQINFDFEAGEIVYLCYRYRQVDKYIAERTIVEAKKCRKMGIQTDTVMISEEDSLLGFVNEMEKHVKGKSYYINPSTIDKVLITDYVNNKKLTIRNR